MLTKEELIPINNNDILKPFIPPDIYADFYFYTLEPLTPPDIYADFYFYTLEPLTPPDIYADFYFYSEILEPTEPTIYCPKQKKSYPESQYPGDAVCKYESCPGIYFDTPADADAYRQANCPGIEPTVECTTDAECPEGYECKNSICVKKTTLGKMSMWQVGMGAGAILGALVLIGQKLRKKEKK